MGKRARFSASRGPKNADTTQQAAMTAGPTTERMLVEGTPEFTDAADRPVGKPVSRQTFPAAVGWPDAVADFLLQTHGGV